MREEIVNKIKKQSLSSYGVCIILGEIRIAVRKRGLRQRLLCLEIAARRLALLFAFRSLIWHPNCHMEEQNTLRFPKVKADVDPSRLCLAAWAICRGPTFTVTHSSFLCLCFCGFFLPLLPPPVTLPEERRYGDRNREREREEIDWRDAGTREK